MQMPDRVMCFKVKVMSLPVRIRRLTRRLIFSSIIGKTDSGKMNVIIPVLFFTFALRSYEKSVIYWK